VKASVLLALPAVLGVVERRWAPSEVGESLWTISLEQLVVLAEGEDDVGCTGALHF
jgi:type IV secretory pathway TrbD component